MKQLTKEHIKVLEDIKRFLLGQGAKLEPWQIEGMVVKYQLSSNVIEEIWYQAQKRLTIAMANAIDDIINTKK